MTEWSSMDCASGVLPCGGVVKKDFQSITSWMCSCVACPRISAATVFLWVSCILAILITSGMPPGFTVRVALGCLVRAECWPDAHHFRCFPSGQPDPSFSYVEVCLCWPRFWLFLQNHMASCLQSSFRVLELLSCQLSAYHSPRKRKGESPSLQKNAVDGSLLCCLPCVLRGGAASTCLKPLCIVHLGPRVGGLLFNGPRDQSVVLNPITLNP